MIYLILANEQIKDLVIKDLISELQFFKKIDSSSYENIDYIGRVYPPSGYVHPDVSTTKTLETSKKRKNILLIGLFGDFYASNLTMNTEDVLVKHTSWSDIPKQNLCDFDLLIFDFNQDSDEVRTGMTLYSGVASIEVPKGIYWDIKQELEKQQKGNGIIIGILGGKKLNYEFNKKDTEIDDIVHSIWQYIPRGYSKRGEKVQLEEGSSDVILRFFQSGMHNFYWNWSINEDDLNKKFNVIARNREGEIVSLIIFNEPGYIILLPAIRNVREFLNFVIENVAKIIKELDNKMYSKRELIVPRPSWIDKWDQFNQSAVKSSISEFNQKLNIILTFEKLVYSDGKELEKSVRFVLDYLGFELLKSSPDRADLIFSKNDIRFVAEVKGLKKKATENSLAQIFKWVSEERLKKERGEMPANQKIKYLFICNTFKEIHPNRRKDPFHEKAIKDAKNNEWGLISTLRLFHALVAIEKGNLDKESIVQAISEQKAEILFE